MKKFLVVLVLLSLAGGAFCYFFPELLPEGETWQKIQQKVVEWKRADDSAAPPAAAGTQESPRKVVSPLPFPENMEARAQAKAAGLPALILWYGSDWHADTGALAKEWIKLADRKLPVVLGQIDEYHGAISKLSNREKLLPTGAFMNLPVAVLLAPDDTLLGIYTGKPVTSAAAMEQAVRSTLKGMPAYMALVEKARALEGVEGARAAGEALAMQPHYTASRNKALKDILNAKDPEHQTLYRYLYGMDHMGMYDEVNAVLNGGKGKDATLKGKNRRFADAQQFVSKVLHAYPINNDLKQQWTSALAYVHREQYASTKDAAAKQKMLECYRQVVAIDPVSEYGKGAARWVRYWDDSVYYEFDKPFYDRGDQTLGFEKEWRVDVSSSMKGPGIYAFSLVPLQNGAMVTRAFKLYANGKHVTDSTTPETVNTKSVEFYVPRSLKGKVEVRFRAQCNDHWHECSGKMVMEKK